MTPTHSRILAAAVPVFARAGYNASTTREIAAAAEVNESTIFRLFGSKRELFEATLSTKLRSVTLPIELVAGIASATDSVDALRSVARLLAVVAHEEAELVRILQFTSLELGDELAPLLRRSLDDALRVLAACVKRPDLQLTDDDLEVMILAILTSTAAARSLAPVLPRTAVAFQHGDILVEALGEINLQALTCLNKSPIAVAPESPARNHSRNVTV
ncbi:MAG TPA: helix-turn-helix domain-containing protein [Acidobacteriaceae bacterium]|nr:helix-turn-helix domain-containing protein [Acidobacteriaceae bacterium]